MQARGGEYTFMQLFKFTLSRDYRIFLLAFGAGALTGIAFTAVFTGRAWFRLEIETTGKLHEWLTMVGTVSAVAVALWLGLRTHRKEETTERTRAVLVAAGLVPQLKIAAMEIKDFVGLVDFTEELRDITNPQRRAAFAENIDDLGRRFDAAVTHPVWDIDIQTLSALAPIPHNAAARLCRGIGLLKNAKQLRFRDDLTPIMKLRSLRAAAARLGSAYELLQVSMSAMATEVRKYELDPSPEELYGDIGSS